MGRTKHYPIWTNRAELRARLGRPRRERPHIYAIRLEVTAEIGRAIITSPAHELLVSLDVHVRRVVEEVPDGDFTDRSNAMHVVSKRNHADVAPAHVWKVETI
jgi:hypothetical protein